MDSFVRHFRVLFVISSLMQGTRCAIVVHASPTFLLASLHPVIHTHLHNSIGPGAEDVSDRTISHSRPSHKLTLAENTSRSPFPGALAASATSSNLPSDQRCPNQHRREMPMSRTMAPPFSARSSSMTLQPRSPSTFRNRGVTKSGTERLVFAFS
ncbi:hypothetical protein SCLCIDRAFT_433632 [Scleroderma citrinum Foug A]|uniref:Secreted protein n=1 Tax=Scleroderma citrinum Foug A TaxID=1036808 RepID=A0A0C2ZLH3_9AGAM|nr:hypothetical protein SCLCIDRAFT_433632 [Scleroderma citrinum Foug A]